MKRLLLDKLIEWKKQAGRKPLVLNGARQTGKTFLLQELLGREFVRVLRLDFLENPILADAFAGSLAPDDVIANIKLLTGKIFNPETDLLILDEIGECQRAVAALNYFADKTPDYFIAASCSNKNFLKALPVGKMQQHNLRPLTFREFLWAANEPMLTKAYELQTNSAAAHTRLLEKLMDYYFTGGMPEAVVTWFDNIEKNTAERVSAVHQVHAALIAGYKRDFSKYTGKVDAQLIEAVFSNIPVQLAEVADESVKRFKFKGIFKRKSRYAEFESPINWLHQCHLVLKNFLIECSPESLLAAHQKDNMVKLFLFDVGLLNHMLNNNYKDIRQQGSAYKGYIAENFVQQEFAAMGMEPGFSWTDARAGIEFIVANEKGFVVPVEVKSGSRTRAKSLQSYIAKCTPHQTIKLTGTRGSPPLEQTHIVMPLYYAEFIFARI